MILQDGDEIKFTVPIPVDDEFVIDKELICTKKRVGDTIEISAFLNTLIPYAFQSCHNLLFIKFEWSPSGIGKFLHEDDLTFELNVKNARYKIAQLISTFIPMGG